MSKHLCKFKRKGAELVGWDEQEVEVRARSSDIGRARHPGSEAWTSGAAARAGRSVEARLTTHWQILTVISKKYRKLTVSSSVRGCLRLSDRLHERWDGRKWDKFDHRQWSIARFLTRLREESTGLAWKSNSYGIFKQYYRIESNLFIIVIKLWGFQLINWTSRIFSLSVRIIFSAPLSHIYKYSIRFTL